MIIPYRLQISYVFAPISNAVIIGFTCVLYFMTTFTIIPESVTDAMVLQEWSFDGMIGCLFLHGGIIHLMGNMLFLWVFGNAINSVVGNIWYPAIYVFLGLWASATHLLFSDMPAVGASGAINGIVGMSLVLFPVNKLQCIYLFAFFGGRVELRSFWLIALWFIFDIAGAASSEGGIAYAAHLGGFTSGIAVATILLAYQKLATYDRSIFDIISGDGKEVETDKLLDPHKIQAAQFDVPADSDTFEYDQFTRRVSEKKKSESPANLSASSPDPFALSPETFESSPDSPASAPDPFEISAKTDPFTSTPSADAFASDPAADDEAGKLDAFFNGGTEKNPPLQEEAPVPEMPAETISIPAVSFRLLRIMRENQQCTCFFVNEGDALENLSVESQECTKTEIYPNKILKNKEPGWIKLGYQEGEVPRQISFTLICRGGSEGKVRLLITVDETSKRMVEG